jgi:hypothetical protein
MFESIEHAVEAAMARLTEPHAPTRGQVHELVTMLDALGIGLVKPAAAAPTPPEPAPPAPGPAPAAAEAQPQATA